MPSWPPTFERRGSVAHLVVNVFGILSLNAMHIWGSLDADWAAAGVLACCGIWIVRNGKPS